MTDSNEYLWHRRPGLFLAIRHVRRHPVPVVMTPLEQLPRLSRRMVKFALRVYPRFLTKADMDFPIIVAGRGWYQIALDGRHRISKAMWTGRAQLPTIRVPWWFALELLIPGFYEVEWLMLFLDRKLIHFRGAPVRPGSPGGPPTRSS